MGAHLHHPQTASFAQFADLTLKRAAIYRDEDQPNSLRGDYHFHYDKAIWVVSQTPKSVILISIVDVSVTLGSGNGRDLYRVTVLALW
jgi:hypothetical protein